MTQCDTHTPRQPRPATIEEISDDDEEAFSDDEQEHNVCTHTYSSYPSN